ncbi:MAG: hypothetical protein ACRES6_05730, partial [Steroidobacteraceae bacterium]
VAAVRALAATAVSSKSAPRSAAPPANIFDSQPPLMKFCFTHHLMSQLGLIASSCLAMLGATR